MNLVVKFSSEMQRNKFLKSLTFLKEDQIKLDDESIKILSASPIEGKAAKNLAEDLDGTVTMNYRDIVF